MMDICMQQIHFRGHFIHFWEVGLWWRMLKMHMNMSREMSNLWNFFILPFIKSANHLWIILSRRLLSRAGFIKGRLDNARRPRVSKWKVVLVRENSSNEYLSKDLTSSSNDLSNCRVFTGIWTVPNSKQLHQKSPLTMKIFWQEHNSLNFAFSLSMYNMNNWVSTVIEISYYWYGSQGDGYNQAHDHAANPEHQWHSSRAKLIGMCLSPWLCCHFHLCSGLPDGSVEQTFLHRSRKHEGSHTRQHEQMS